MSSTSHILDAESFIEGARNAHLTAGASDPEEATKADLWVRIAQVHALLAIAKAIGELQPPQ